MASARTYSDDEYADALEGKKSGPSDALRRFLDKLNNDSGGALARLSYDAPARALHLSHTHFDRQIAEQQAVIRRGEYVIHPNHVHRAVYGDNKRAA